MNQGRSTGSSSAFVRFIQSMILEYMHQKLYVKLRVLESFTSELLETLSALIENKYSKWNSTNQKHSNRGRIYTNILHTKRNQYVLDI